MRKKTGKQMKTAAMNQNEDIVLKTCIEMSSWQPANSNQCSHFEDFHLKYVQKHLICSLFRVLYCWLAIWFFTFFFCHLPSFPLSLAHFIACGRLCLFFSFSFEYIYVMNHTNKPHSDSFSRFIYFPFLSGNRAVSVKRG